jgi:hypothetical protein
MPELVVPDALDDHDLLDDDCLSPSRDLVGRRVFSFDGPLDEALALAEVLSGESGGQPVLVNDVTAETDDGRIVDVYMHQGGRRRSVSEDVERPSPSE